MNAPSKKFVSLLKRYRTMTKPYDVPSDHAYSRQSIEAQRLTQLEQREKALVEVVRDLLSIDDGHDDLIISRELRERAELLLSGALA
jgi:hypothetical protein